MSYTVEFLPSAQRELAALPKDVHRRIANRIDALREDPRPPGVKQLQGVERLYRHRVGDYRVIYSIEGRRLVIIVVKVGHRREVYRKP
ncbi:MAG TPA: type II toxin-antitoxin system RelE/ParE family toxin [Methylomirabilota bacterium]|nr:type II toxin-antitoxin system RelE/ParE family toxin [Methylomirabilota bacterium]